MNIPRNSKAHPPPPRWEIRCEVYLNGGTKYVPGKGFERTYEGTEIRSFYMLASTEEFVRDQIHDKFPWTDCSFGKLLEIREVS